MRTLDDLGEDAVIELFARDSLPPPPEVIVPNGDDAAVFSLRAGYAAVATTDSLVEGIHFDLTFAEPSAVGRKLIAVNLSDLAAMGAEPRFALLALSLPGSTPLALAEAIAGGIRERAKQHGVYLAGGNVSRIHGPIVLGATLIGEVVPGEVLRRSGAQAGDGLWVTGTLGDARLGLEVARKDHPRTAAGRALIARLVDPEARVGPGRMLAGTGRVHAAADLSDGLARDLGRLLSPNGLGARIFAGALPLSPALREVAAILGLDPIAIAVEGGEDYELLIAAPLEAEDDLHRAAARAGVALTKIGEVTAHPPIELCHDDGLRRPLGDGFDHFRPS